MGTLLNLPPPPSLLKFLLFRQVSLLAVFCGILASREPLAGSIALLLLLITDLPRTRSIARAGLLLLFFLFGAVYTILQPFAASQQIEPAWVQSLSTPPPTFSLSPQGIPLPIEPPPVRPPLMRLSGIVEKTTPLFGNRVRVFLRNAHPVQSSNGTTKDGSPTPLISPDALDQRISWTWRNPTFIPIPGDEITASLRLSEARGFANPGAWNAEESWQDQQIRLRAWSNGNEKGEAPQRTASNLYFATLRHNIQRSFLAALPPAHEAYSVGTRMLPALLFGDRSLLSPAEMDLIAKSTLMHSLALSGMHLAYAAVITYSLIFCAGFFASNLWHILPRIYFALPISLIPAVLYLWIGQAPISLVRSAFMLVMCVVALLLRRTPMMIDGLFISVSIILLCDPTAFFDISLQLSALSTAILAITAQPVANMARSCIPAKSFRLPWVASTLQSMLGVFVMSAIIQIALMPITIRTFGTAGLWFPLNVLWLPVLGMLVMPLTFLAFALCAINLPQLAQTVLSWASLPCDALMHVLAWMQAKDLLFAPVMWRPHWLTSLGFWLACLVLPAFIRTFRKNKNTPRIATGAPLPLRPFLLLHKRLLLLTICAAIFMAGPCIFTLYTQHAQRIRVRLLDVGQGEAILLEWPGGRALVDGGGMSDFFDAGKALVSPIITDNASPHMQFLVNSHPDGDHLGGLLYLLHNFTVGTYVTNGDTPRGLMAQQESTALTQAGLQKTLWKAGDIIQLSPDVTLEVLWPPTKPASSTLSAAGTSPAIPENTNNNSLILRLLWKKEPLALLCGDAGGPVLQRLIAEKAPLRAPVLILPHHGSATSCVPAFYDAVAPHMALAPCGYGNQWGFPAESVRKALHERGIALYSTAMRGQITLEWKSPTASPSLTLARPEIKF